MNAQIAIHEWRPTAAAWWTCLSAMVTNQYAGKASEQRAKAHQHLYDHKTARLVSEGICHHQATATFAALKDLRAWLNSWLINWKAGSAGDAIAFVVAISMATVASSTWKSILTRMESIRSVLCHHFHFHCCFVHMSAFQFCLQCHLRYSDSNWIIDGFGHRHHSCFNEPFVDGIYPQIRSQPQSHYEVAAATIFVNSNDDGDQTRMTTAADHEH